jgi:hypothetical protein
MWLVNKFKEKFKDFNVKWNINCKNDKNTTNWTFKYEKNYIEKISMQFIIKLFILWWTIF